MESHISDAVDRAAERKKAREQTVAVARQNAQDERLLASLIERRKDVRGKLSSYKTTRIRLENEEKFRRAEAAQSLEWAERAVAGQRVTEPEISRLETELAEVEELIAKLQ